MDKKAQLMLPGEFIRSTGCSWRPTRGIAEIVIDRRQDEVEHCQLLLVGCKETIRVGWSGRKNVCTEYVAKRFRILSGYDDC